MSSELTIVLIGIITLAIGLFLGMYIQKLKTKSLENVWEERKRQFEETKASLTNSLSELESEKKQIQKEKEDFDKKLNESIIKYDNLKGIYEEQKKNEKTLQEKFENLANRILSDKSEKFTKKNEENIKNILNPLEKKIKEFEGKVQENQDKNIGIHAALKEQLEILKNQNLKITQEANNLTKALKGDSKTQGNWGEMVLENVLEKSNLTKDREYFVQKSFLDEDGDRQIPDVVINLPEGKRMIIDSKVSLKAYENYSSAEDEDEKKVFLKKHIESLKTHISQLKQKKYEDIYKTESPDFVLMFVPIEPALYLAQNEDNSFFFTAFNQNILLVSPTTLLSVLRTIDTIWKNEKQQQNAIEIANHATSLYSKFNNLLLNLETVGNRIKSTKTAYDDAMKKLTGNQNLIKDIDKLEKLGIAPKSKISQKWLDKANIESDEEKPKLEL